MILKKCQQCFKRHPSSAVKYQKERREYDADLYYTKYTQLEVLRNQWCTESDWHFIRKAVELDATKVFFFFTFFRILVQARISLYRCRDYSNHLFHDYRDPYYGDDDASK